MIMYFFIISFNLAGTQVECLCSDPRGLQIVLFIYSQSLM